MADRELKTAPQAPHHRTGTHPKTEARDASLTIMAPQSCEIPEGPSPEGHLRLLAGAPTPEKRAALVRSLQRRYGNRYVQRLFRTAAGRALTPGPVENTEPAALAADLNPAVLPRQSEEEEEEMLQVTPPAGEYQGLSRTLNAAIRRELGGGQPLPRSLQARWEPALGPRIRTLRIHHDQKSDALARALKAASFTSGRDIFFRRGAYNPDSAPGRRLIAREIYQSLKQARRASPAPAQTNPGSAPAAPLPLSVTPVSLLAPGKTGRLKFWADGRSADRSNHPGPAGVPFSFVNNGKTGSAAVWWGGGGGGGGQGNQPVGSVDEVVPDIRTFRPGSMGTGGQVSAWVAPGTGTARVTRSYVGVLVGANGTYYITQRAVAQIDRHEEDHVNSSQSYHDTYITPLEARVAEHTGQNQAREGGATPAEARTALERYLNWSASINDFRTHDTAANTPGGTVDQADLADPNTKFDYGPREVNGTSYAHYVDTPPGPPAEPAQTTGSTETSGESTEGTSESSEEWWDDETGSGAIDEGSMAQESGESWWDEE